MTADGDEELVSSLHEGKRRFLALVADLRPELHRYCARMTGSVADGEDVVQDTLARAYYALAEVEAMPPLRPWLFQIAHHRAIDHLRRYDRRHGRALDEGDEPADPAPDPEDRLASLQATRLAVARFCELAPAQRSVVILKDVLGHSVDEITRVLGISEPAAKSALHRGRERLRALPPDDEAVAATTAASPTVARYTELFNARDWDGVRALLADDVRLDLVARAERFGRRDVAHYFTRYDAVTDWHLAAGRVDGREAIVVRRDGAPAYLVELTVLDGRIALIKDFRYVPYILAESRPRTA